MLVKLLSIEKREKNTYLLTIHDSHYNTGLLLNDLQISEEMFEEISKSDSNNKLILILNDEETSNDFKSKMSLDLKYPSLLEYKNFKINTDLEEVYINNKRFKITALEYKLLLFFIHNAKKLISRNEIINYLWENNDKPSVSVDAVYTHIKNLKRKIMKSGVGNFIHSIYGQGYKFEDPEEVIF